MFFKLFLIKWDFVHAINYDSILPAIIVSKLKRKRLIYELYDTYEDSIKLPELLRLTCLQIDKIFMKLSNAVIIVDESRIKEFNGIPNCNISIIYNSPRDLQNKQKILKRNGTFTIFYAGLLDKGRSIENMIEAAKSIEGIELIIAGFGSLSQQIKNEAKCNINKIKFIGLISHEEVLKYTFQSDLLFSLYDPKIPLYKFASSNKLFEAMMCGKPILVSKNTGMDKIVINENCGITVDCSNINEIRSAIIKLKENPELYFHLAYNARKAYEQKYNWEIMEQRLVDFYKYMEAKN